MNRIAILIASVFAVVQAQNGWLGQSNPSSFSGPSQQFGQFSQARQPFFGQNGPNPSLLGQSNPALIGQNNFNGPQQSFNGLQGGGGNGGNGGASGGMVRECSCQETSLCMDEMKRQGKTCIESCWFNFNQITSRPQDLRRCFERKGDLIENFMQCFKANMDGCVNNMNGPMIPRQDFTSIFRHTEGEVSQQPGAEALRSVLMAPLKKVIDTAKGFGRCVKQCFTEKNAGGVCLEQFGCQPLLPTEDRAKAMFKTCSSGMDFRKEGGELCTCAVQAGVTDLTLYCPMLAIFGAQAAQNLG